MRLYVLTISICCFGIMAGVLVIVCIPTENHEAVLRKKEAEKDKFAGSAFDETNKNHDSDDDEQVYRKREHLFSILFL